MELDLKNTPVISLINDYQDVYLVLTHPSLPHRVSLRMRDASKFLIAVTDTTTVDQWLISLDSTTLPTTNYIPMVNTKSAIYNDIYNAGYKVELSHRTAHHDAELPDADKTDIRLTRPDTDYGLFYQSCLVTVNGLIHRTDYNEYGVYVLDAATAVRKCNEHHLGAISFHDIGKLELIQVNTNNLRGRDGVSLYECAYIDLPVDLGNRIPVLVLGGYLQVLDNSYSMVSDRTIKVSVKATPYIDRFFASRKAMDVSAMETLCNRDSRNDSHFVYDDLISDEVIRAYLTLNNTFLVLVDTDNLYTEYHTLEQTQLPGRYYSYRKPKWPLVTTLGSLPAYVADKEVDRWVVMVYENLQETRRYQTHEYRLELSLDDSKETVKPYYYAPGYLLEIGSDVKA